MPPPTPPDASRPAARPRGAAVLRWIAAFKLLKAAGLIVLGVVVARLALADGRGDAAAAAHAWVDRIPAGSHVRLAHRLLAKAQVVPPGRLELLAAGLFVYAGLFAVEGVGLLRGKRWAERMVVVTTAVLVPVEAYELATRPTAARAVLLGVNVAVVAYLVASRWCARRTSDAGA